MNKAPLKGMRALHGFAVSTAVATFLLLGMGGLVTSNGAGMSVPDWPTSFGYNMFLLPIKFWRGGVFYEHTHRLFASLVGCMTIILAIWIWMRDPRKWVKWLGVAAAGLIVAQGILGGLRVILTRDQLGMLHGVIGQVFFILMCALALFTGRTWAILSERPQAAVPRHLRTLVLATTLLIFGQLIVGAAMRHQHAGLAVPDFPLAYGKVWPDINADAVAGYNARRMEITGVNPITSFQIILQMVHRILALVILACVAICARQAWRQLGAHDALARCALFWLTLIVAQITLGAATIWTNKAADVATSHVLVGALSLVTGALWCIIAFGRSANRLAPGRMPGGRANALHDGAYAPEAFEPVAANK